MIASAIFARYARALADVVMEKQQEPEVTGELETYRKLFRAVPDLLKVFHSPAVPRDAKQRLLEELMARHPVSATTGNFLRVLVQHHRIRYFEEICEYYAKTVNDRKGILTAEVTCAHPLSEKDQSALRSALSSATGRTVKLSARFDPELLGGLVVQIGSVVYDGSIRRQLAEMRERLAGGKQ